MANESVGMAEMIGVMKRRWAIWMSAILLAVTGSFIAWLITPSEYTASTTLYVAAQGTESTSGAYQGGQLSEQRVKSYVEVANGPRVAIQAAGQLGISPGEVQKAITATTTTDSVVVQIDATAVTPPQAVNIANVVGATLIEVVKELEQPAIPGAVPAVQLKLVQAAIAPTTPSSTSLPVALALGLLGGIIIGTIAAYLTNYLDNRIRTSESLTTTTGLPTLGIVSSNKTFEDTPLVIAADPKSTTAEEIRQIRTSLQYLSVGVRNPVTLVTSAIAAEGKSTTAANLAIALSLTSSRTLLIDADLRRPTLAKLFGLDQSVGLTTVLTGSIAATRAVQEWSSSLHILASGRTPPNPSELIGSNLMADMISELRSRYDHIIVDTSPILPVTDATILNSKCDRTILVCRSNSTTVSQIRLAQEALAAGGGSAAGAILTFVSRANKRDEYGRYSAYGDGSTPAEQFAPSRHSSSMPTSGPNPHTNHVVTGKRQDAETKKIRYSYKTPSSIPQTEGHSDSKG